MRTSTLRALTLLGLVFLTLSLATACDRSEETQYAPSFTLQSMDDTIVNLSDFRGRPVMLTFWRINCSACQFQMPFMQSLYDKWSTDSLAVLTINVGDRVADVREYMSNRGVNYPVLLDMDHKVAQAYRIIGVPMTFFIDGEGVLKAYQIGAFKDENDMENAIKKVFPSIKFIPKVETSPEIGKLAPDFTLQTTDDHTLSLNELRGKTILLNFWVSSCDACVTELPYLQAASDNQTDEPAVILVVDCGESSQVVHSIIDGLQLSVPVLLDRDGSVCTSYKRGAPTAFIIDSKGIIRAIKDDAFESPQEVADMLNSVP